jgi:ATP-binding cassette, subfamily B, bacterial
LEEDKLEYIVGDNGVKLSGGQRQKVALARDFYRDKEVCILDEANSNTDIFMEFKKMLLNYHE